MDSSSRNSAPTKQEDILLKQKVVLVSGRKELMTFTGATLLHSQLLTRILQTQIMYMAGKSN